MIDDKYIKERIKIYQATKSSITLSEIVEHLSKYIYHYPRKIFANDHDSANDFYIYTLERIDNILLKYSESDVLFITWFTLTLRNTYFNYSKMKNARKRKYERDMLSLDNINEEFTLHDVINIKSDDNESTNFYTLRAKNIFETIETEFEMKDVLIFSLHNLELFIRVIIDPLKIFFDITVDEVYKIFEKARSLYIKKYNEVMFYQDIISNTNYRIEKYSKVGKDTSKLLKKKEDYKKRIDSLRFVVPYSYISELFNTSINAVNKIILKIKKYLNS